MNEGMNKQKKRAAKDERRWSQSCGYERGQIERERERVSNTIL